MIYMERVLKLSLLVNLNFSNAFTHKCKSLMQPAAMRAGLGVPFRQSSGLCTTKNVKFQK